jgi:hypothetical protein
MKHQLVTTQDAGPVLHAGSAQRDLEISFLPVKGGATRWWLFLAAIAAGIALLALMLPASAWAGGDTPPPSRVLVQIPQAAGTANVVMLELSLRVMNQTATGNLGAVVRLSGGSGNVEVGRLSIVSGSQSYQFNLGIAVKRLGLAGGSAEVEVTLIDRGGGPPPSGVGLSIGQARIVTR